MTQVENHNERKKVMVSIICTRQKEKRVCPTSNRLIMKETELQILQVMFDAYVIEVASKIMTTFLMLMSLVITIS